MTKWSSMFWPPVENVYSDKRMDKNMKIPSIATNWNLEKNWRNIFQSSLGSLMIRRNAIYLASVERNFCVTIFFSCHLWCGRTISEHWRSKEKRKKILFHHQDWKKIILHRSHEFKNQNPNFIFLIKLFFCNFLYF